MGATVEKVRVRGSVLSFADFVAIAMAVCVGIWLFCISVVLFLVLGGTALLLGLAEEAQQRQQQTSTLGADDQGAQDLPDWVYPTESD